MLRAVMSRAPVRINYKKVIRHLEECGYTGRVGYELFPLTDTAAAVKAIMENA